MNLHREIQKRVQGPGRSGIVRLCLILMLASSLCGQSARGQQTVAGQTNMAQAKILLKKYNDRTLSRSEFKAAIRALCASIQQPEEKTRLTAFVIFWLHRDVVRNITLMMSLDQDLAFSSSSEEEIVEELKYRGDVLQANSVEGEWGVIIDRKRSIEALRTYVQAYGLLGEMFKEPAYSHPPPAPVPESAGDSKSVLPPQDAAGNDIVDTQERLASLKQQLEEVVDRLRKKNRLSDQDFAKVLADSPLEER